MTSYKSVKVYKLDQRLPVIGSFNDSKPKLNGQRKEDTDLLLEHKMNYFKHINLFGVQFIIFLVLMPLMIVAACYQEKSKLRFFKIDSWKWGLLLITMVCGKLVSSWLVWFIVKLFEFRCALHKRCLYFVYGIRKQAENCFWMTLILLSYTIMFHDTLKHIKLHGRNVLAYMTKVLVFFLVFTFLQLAKVLVVKIASYYYHGQLFFSKLQKALYGQYLLEELGSSPVIKYSAVQTGKVSDQFRIKSLNIPVANPLNVSAWTLKMMKKIIRKRAVILTDQLDINDENSANVAAKKLFSNIAANSGYLFFSFTFPTSNFPVFFF